MVVRITQEEFVSLATEKHGGKYSYDKTVYKNYGDKVIITCPIHGDFLQVAKSHLRGHGCRKCSDDRCGLINKDTQESWLEKANKIHNGRYDYSLVKYINSQTKIDVICAEHGIFSIRPAHHLIGQGCRKCGYIKNGISQYISQEEYLTKVRAVHGDRYDYSLVNYVKTTSKLRIICSEHGEFVQIAAVHLAGHGCPKCSRNKLLTTEEFIEASRKRHGDLYDYSQTEYIRSHLPVDIICKQHGVFTQTAESHMLGAGCRYCRMGGFRGSLPGFVYLLESDDWIKVGVSKNVEHRVSCLNSASTQEFKIITKYPLNGKDCLLVEKAVHCWLRAVSYPIQDKFAGSSECFLKYPLPQVIDKIEEEITKLQLSNRSS